MGALHERARGGRRRPGVERVAVVTVDAVHEAVRRGISASSAVSCAAREGAHADVYFHDVAIEEDAVVGNAMAYDLRSRGELFAPQPPGDRAADIVDAGADALREPAVA